MKTPLIIVSAPSGAGKSSLCQRALQEFSQLIDSVSYTTRSPRVGEMEGNPYHFVSEKKFLELKDSGFFAEWAQVHGNFYGTPRHQIEDASRDGKIMIMDLDVNGAYHLKKTYPDAVTIFILPPSVDVLRARITARDQGKTPNLDLRLKNAESEMKEASNFDHRLINDEFEKSYLEFKKIIKSLL